MEQSDEHESREDDPESRAARFNAWVRRSPPVILVGLALFLFVLISQVVRDGGAALSWYRRTYDWRSVEYARLSRLHSDLTVVAFENSLGPPLFESQSYDHRWTEYLFQGRSYWVQAITARGGKTVDAFAVTACDPSFQPTFYAFRSKIVLNHSDIPHVRVPFADFSYTIPADANPWFYAFIGGSRASNFQSFAWGEDGACWALKRSVAPGERFSLGKGVNEYQGVVPLRRIPKKFSQSLVINTFAEWGPNQDSWPTKYFHIGVDEFHLIALLNSAPPHR